MGMGRPREFDVKNALDRAMEVFWSKGYDGASMAELTKAMGINSPSLYACFGSKEGLFKAVLDRYAELRIQFLDDALAEPTARQAASTLLSSAARLYAEENDYRGCLLVQGGLTCGCTTIPEELAKRRERVELALRDRFARALSEGDLGADANPASAARYVVSVLIGMGVQATAGASRSDLQEIADLAMQAFPATAKAEAAASA
ncbi:TetR family transcriptional regulator [Agaricicola taiwanensis]|uniref:TetR family transcriptional regulator n=1 Tax=Agaricicola taiwanensis TaxID=591372 RepID=A0A8J2VLM0_9RHOB|nr:TetR/AcrR family transcriptional regulator [Agaricicola taiwanensis]GGE31093.1 TetR family transcriptional regulator [Agaricicola taiwanensis]